MMTANGRVGKASIGRGVAGAPRVDEGRHRLGAVGVTGEGVLARFDEALQPRRPARGGAGGALLDLAYDIGDVVGLVHDVGLGESRAARSWPSPSELISLAFSSGNSGATTTKPALTHDDSSAV